MTKTYGTTRTALAAGLAASLIAGAASAQETINLTAVSGYSPTASWVKIFEEYYIPEVERLLAEQGEYEINWNRGFSGTIVKPRGELEAVADGIADIGIVVPVFHTDRLPLHNVSFVTPFATGDLQLVVRAMNEIAAEVPAFKQEWNDLNLVYLGSSGSVDNYQAVCTEDKPQVEDFEGTKVVGAGTNLRYFTGVGAVGVNSNLGDYYNQLQTGIGECASVWAESAAGFKLYEVAPHLIKADQGATVSFALAANQDRWNGLPEAVKSVLQEAARGYGIALADYVEDVSESSLETFKENGGTITEYTHEQRVEWADKLPNLAREWAESANEAGKPGTEVLEAYMDFLREHDQPIARQWDRE